MARARRQNKHTRGHRPLAAGLGAARESGADGSWVVRTVTGSAATKPYTCPGCHRPVPVGTSHLVVWPTEAGLGADVGVTARRHWHTHCWRTR